VSSLPIKAYLKESTNEDRCNHKSRKASEPDFVPWMNHNAYRKYWHERQSDSVRPSDETRYWRQNFGSDLAKADGIVNQSRQRNAPHKKSGGASNGNRFVRRVLRMKCDEHELC
jgi:hypothetical protein